MTTKRAAAVGPLRRTSEQTVAADDLAALEVLYSERFVPMLRLATMLTQSRTIGEEIVQDSFIALHQARHRIEGEPGAYLRRIVINASMGHHRRAAVAARHLASDDRVVLPPDVDETWDALQYLTGRQRVALVLRFYEDLSVQGVADAMDCRLGTAKSLIHRGLQALKEVLDHD